MMLKASKYIRVNKIQTITLLEAGNNLALKMMGKSLMAHTEQHNWLAKEQYGSMKGHSAILHGLHKHLFYNITRKTGRPVSICCNDASQCYDRVEHPVLVAILLKCGMSLNTIFTLVNTIEGMSHHV